MDDTRCRINCKRLPCIIMVSHPLHFVVVSVTYCSQDLKLFMIPVWESWKEKEVIEIKLLTDMHQSIYGSSRKTTKPTFG